MRNQLFLSRARTIEAERRSLPGTDPTPTLVVVGTDKFWSYLDSRYARVRSTDDYVIFALVNTELANRPVDSVPISKFAATFQAVETDDEPTTS